MTSRGWRRIYRTHPCRYGQRHRDGSPCAPRAGTRSGASASPPALRSADPRDLALGTPSCRGGSRAYASALRTLAPVFRCAERAEPRELCTIGVFAYVCNLVDVGGVLFVADLGLFFLSTLVPLYSTPPSDWLSFSRGSRRGAGGGRSLPGGLGGLCGPDPAVASAAAEVGKA